MIILLIQAALEYITIRYKLNPFKSMQEVKAGVYIGVMFHFLPACTLSTAMHHARDGAKRKVMSFEVLHLIA